MTEHTTKRICDACKEEIPTGAAHVAVSIYGAATPRGTCRHEAGDLCAKCAAGLGLLALFPSVDD